MLQNKFKALSTSPHLANMSINALLSSALFCTLPFHRKTPLTSLTRAHLNPCTHSNWNHYDLIRTNTLDLQFPKQTNRITRPPHLHVPTNHRTSRNGIQLAHFIEHLSWKLNPSFLSTTTCTHQSILHINFITKPKSQPMNRFTQVQVPNTITSLKNKRVSEFVRGNFLFQAWHYYTNQ